MESVARMLIITGIILVLIGIFLYLLARFPALKLFRLPGDIYIEKDNFAFYFPVVTMLLISLVLTIILNLIFFFLNKK